MKKQDLTVFVFGVDSYVRPALKRNTKGLYIVCHKNKNKAQKLLQEKIGFGAIRYYGIIKNNLDLNKNDAFRLEIEREKKICNLFNIRHANDNINNIKLIKSIPIEIIYNDYEMH